MNLSDRSNDRKELLFYWGIAEYGLPVSLTAAHRWNLRNHSWHDFMKQDQRSIIMDFSDYIKLAIMAIKERFG